MQNTREVIVKYWRVGYNMRLENQTLLIFDVRVNVFVDRYVTALCVVGTCLIATSMRSSENTTKILAPVSLATASCCFDY